jgi:FtsH-binding integral membrane protein
MGNKLRYGLLVFSLVLTIFSAIVAAHLPSGQSGRYFGFVVPPMLLFNHLAFNFRWHRSVTLGLRGVAFLSCGAVMGYTLFVMFGRG